MANVNGSEQAELTIENLESQIQSLIDEQKQLNKRVSSLQRRNLKLEELNILKDEFIAIASHQLRTPATAVKQYIELVLSGYSDELTENQKLFLDKANDSNNRQLRIIDDLLQIARIDSSTFKLKTEMINLRELMDKIVVEARDKIINKHQNLDYKGPAKDIFIKGDPDRLTMLYENLIENAANYSPAESSIEVCLKKTAQGAVTEVIDSGVGIDRSDFSKLFQKFSRIPNPLSVEVGGTGLGLYWALKVAKLHGGIIDVKSSLGKGSTFKVTLPIEN